MEEELLNDLMLRFDEFEKSDEVKNVKDVNERAKLVRDFIAGYFANLVGHGEFKEEDYIDMVDKLIDATSELLNRPSDTNEKPL